MGGLPVEFQYLPRMAMAGIADLALQLLPFGQLRRNQPLPLLAIPLEREKRLPLILAAGLLVIARQPIP